MGSSRGQGNPTLQFWHIPPVKRGCSRVTLRLPQEMQMSREQREYSECPSPRTKGGSRKATKKGRAGAAAFKKSGRKESGRRPMERGTGWHRGPVSEAPPSLRASLLPSRSSVSQGRDPPTRTGPCPRVTPETVLGQSLSPRPPPPSFPGLRVPKLDTPSLDLRQTWDANNDHWRKEGDERRKARKSSSGKFNQIQERPPSVTLWSVPNPNDQPITLIGRQDYGTRRQLCV